MFVMENISNFISPTLSCCVLSGAFSLLAHILPLSANSIFRYEISPSQKPVEPVEPNGVFNETIHTRVQQFS